MKLVDDSKISLASLGFVLACVVGARPAAAEFTFSTPTNLGSLINTRNDEGRACISADGLSLYFDSNRLGSFGGLTDYRFSLPPTIPAAQVISTCGWQGAIRQMQTGMCLWLLGRL